MPWTEGLVEGASELAGSVLSHKPVNTLWFQCPPLDGKQELVFLTTVPACDTSHDLLKTAEDICFLIYGNPVIIMSTSLGCMGRCISPEALGSLALAGCYCVGL